MSFVFDLLSRGIFLYTSELVNSLSRLVKYSFPLIVLKKLKLHNVTTGNSVVKFRNELLVVDTLN